MKIVYFNSKIFFIFELIGERKKERKKKDLFLSPDKKSQTDLRIKG